MLIDVLLLLSVMFGLTGQVISQGSSPITGYRCANESSFICDANCTYATDKIRKDYSKGWAVRHPSIGQTYHKLNCSIAVEVGIARAELSTYLLDHVANIREYHGVDPFLSGYDPRDVMSTKGFANISSTAWRDAILVIMSKYDCRFRMHFGPSNTMSQHFANESVDCVFIDGDHSYEGAKTDINTWAHKVRPGGALLFDDHSVHFPGVVRAVHEFIDGNQLRLVQINKHNNYYIVLNKVNGSNPLKFF